MVTNIFSYFIFKADDPRIPAHVCSIVSRQESRRMHWHNRLLQDTQKNSLHTTRKCLKTFFVKTLWLTVESTDVLSLGESSNKVYVSAPVSGLSKKSGNEIVLRNTSRVLTVETKWWRSFWQWNHFKKNLFACRANRYEQMTWHLFR